MARGRARVIGDGARRDLPVFLIASHASREPGALAEDS